MKTPVWRPEEFETLLQHPGSDAQAVAELLPGRKMGAVEVIRQGIHAHHTGMKTPMLSEMMVHRLQRGSVICPLCQTRL